MTTQTVSVPGATLTYDVIGELEPGVTPLVLIGSPMDASGFGTLASHFRDRVVVTYDPRNVGRSRRDDTTAAVTFGQHADDLHAVLTAVGHGPVDVFASSGGAVNALVLVSRYPSDVRMLVAHEPPAGGTLPDRENIATVCANMVAAYDAHGRGPAMAQFMALLMHAGPIDNTFFDRPAPDPAQFGLSAEDDGTRDDALMSNMRGGGVDFAPDVDAVRAAPTTVVIGVGEESGGPEDGHIAARAAYSTASTLGSEPIVFPGGHSGFLGGEFGQMGKPTEFAEKLRKVLS
ncbi:alpha/beta fold hydrolase [Rhodococcoides fascians]|uniref:alpha/beta fold hydrolase n=1 Tax=Rhodococcoides fascians TaxID=1828 RepID=UPI00050C464B|nr:alpha/beta hydrolase [Rhodococcus fascians]AMY53657.1 putative hydrolase [Rhodococcus fascians D188]